MAASITSSRLSNDYLLHAHVALVHRQHVDNLFSKAHTRVLCFDAWQEAVVEAAAISKPLPCMRKRESRHNYEVDDVEFERWPGGFLNAERAGC